MAAVATRVAGRQPLMGVAWFHDVVLPPVRSKWPSWAVPSPLLVQFLQVWSAPSLKAFPSVVDPVRMSC